MRWENCVACGSTPRFHRHSPDGSSVPLPTQILRLLLVLFAPLWLSMMTEALDLRVALLPNWRRVEAPATPAARAPADWQEHSYLRANPDVADAVHKGVLASGYLHYLEHGRAEGRRGGFPAQEATPASEMAVVSPPVPVVMAPPISPEAPPPPPLQSATPGTAVAVVASPPVPLSKPLPPEMPVAVVTPVGKGTVETALPGVKPALSLPEESDQRHVSGIRIANRGDGIRIVLDLDQEARSGKPVSLSDGWLAVPLPETRWRVAPAGRLAPTVLNYRTERDGNGTRLLMGPNDSGRLRLIALTKLPPDQGRGHRLVVDVALLAKGR